MISTATSCATRRAICASTRSSRAPPNSISSPKSERRGLCLTNRNHTRATNLMRARLGARTTIHPDDADYARGQGAEIDDALAVGDRLGPLQVVGVPGKSPGEVALFWEERKLLIVGDALIGNPPGRCGLLPEKVMDNPVQLKESITKLLALDFDTLLMGDGVSILAHGKDRLRELAASSRG